MDYKPGLIAASLGQGKKKAGANNPQLTQLFSKTALPPTTSKVTDENKNQVVKKKNPKRKKNGIKLDPIAKADHVVDNTVVKKRKNEEPMSITKAKKAKNNSSVSESRNHSSSISNDFPFLHESLQVDSQSSQKKAKKVKKDVKKRDTLELDDETPSRKKNRRDKTSDKRTVFVGNCPLSSDKKIMTKLFKDFGAIESIRFRCGPAAQLDLPRRAVIIKKEFHEKASSYVCYIVFKAEDSAQNALQMNGHVLDGLHLRVDLASNHKKHDKKRSVFVGNLPFTVTEEDLRSHFRDCGEISNVRIVRDRQTSVGKGIAYVQFESKDGVTLAKKLNSADFQGRQLRVMTCTNKPVKKPDDKAHMKNKTSRPLDHPEKKKINFAPSNRKPTTNNKKTFSEMLLAKKEKRLKKVNKKKQVSQKSDGLSSIFGDMSADMKKLKTSNPKMREKKEKKPGKKGKGFDKKGKGIDKKGKGIDKKGKGFDKKGKGIDKKGKGIDKKGKFKR